MWRELEWIKKKLPSSTYTMDILGHCAARHEYGVELLVKLGYVAGSASLVWCARLDLAKRVLKLLMYVARHCHVRARW